MNESYANWLSSKHWDNFLTVTFRSPRREPYYALKAVTHVIEPLYAKAFLVAEPHQTGDLHIHGIAEAETKWRPRTPLPWDIEDLLNKKFGRSRVEAIENTGGVAGYCSKYITKSERLGADFYEIIGDKSAWRT